ncbi:flavodoxin reductase [Hwangdonia sp.]|uniref:flavodoxin reductase n=1 Tax=Hwangdonia sp. TaxID=1883432 RepID=UPI003AB243FF
MAHNVIQLSIEKPEPFTYNLGQAVEISLPEGKNFLKAPFTLTSIYEKDKDLQFIIKIYQKHHGITAKLAQLKVNDSILISEAWDSFTYKGPGVFIAAGSGITPFIPILRLLKEQNNIEGHRLIFANRKAQDIILKKELKEILQNRFHNILSRDHLSHHAFGHIDYEFLEATISNTNQNFYLCGPISLLKSAKKDLVKLGVNQNLIQTIY